MSVSSRNDQQLYRGDNVAFGAKTRDEEVRLKGREIHILSNEKFVHGALCIMHSSEL